MGSEERYAAEQAVLGAFFGEAQRDSLVAKYGHETLWRSFSNATETLSALKNLPLKARVALTLLRFVRGWRIRVQKIQAWLEA